MNILKMTPQNKDDIKAGLIGALFVVFIIVVLTGCTWTFHRSPMKLHIPETIPSTEDVYRYYVIDDHSKIPDAYFETKTEAENYKKYFEEHHNYKIMSIK